MIVIGLILVAAAAGIHFYDARHSSDTLILVNRDHPLPDNYRVSLKTFDGGNKVARIIYRPLDNMFDDMRAEGLSPRLNSAYRSESEQIRIMDEYIDDFMNENGLSYESASRRALDYVSMPGTSEHETGLAVDISSSAGDDDMFRVYDWLAENAYLYGFIKRYPAGSEDITGYDEELWHYRYVGTDAAREIYELDITLEEYLDTDDTGEY